MLAHREYMIFWVVMGVLFFGGIVLYWELRGSKLRHHQASASDGARPLSVIVKKEKNHHGL